MARTPTYWYDVILAEKQTMTNLSVLQPTIDDAQTLLTDVKSSSRVARWRLWLWAVAVCAYTLDVVFDLTLIAFEALAKRSRFGTLPWYIQKGYDFQFGDTLVFQNNEFQYVFDNPAIKIIKRAAAQEVGNTVNVKVAKLSGGIPAKLSLVEYTAAKAYFEKIKPAGVYLNLISDDPDEIRIYLNVNFDPLIYDNTGQLLSSPGTYPIIDAINNFIVNVIFDGRLELCDLIDAVQALPGSPSCYDLGCYGRYGANPFTQFTERYYPNSGHMKIDPTNPLTATITYTPFN